MFQTFVIMGNMELPFQRLIEIVLESISFLPKPILIQGKNVNLETIPGNVTVVDIMNFTDFNRTIESSKVVISHAGVGVIVQTLKTGKRPLVIPRMAIHNEHINDHQLDLVKYLENSGEFIYSFSSKKELCDILKCKSLVYDSALVIPLFDNDKITQDIKQYLTTL